MTERPAATSTTGDRRPGVPAAGAFDRLRAGRPEFSQLFAFYAAYVFAGGVSQGLAVIPGMSITFWPPAGLFMVTLLLSEKRRWLWWVIAGWLAELTCNEFWFRNPFPFPTIYFAANALEALAGALLLQRFAGKPFRLHSLERVSQFFLFAVMLAPMVGATIIGATDALTDKHDFWTAWKLVWLGDATGLLVSAPLTLVAAELWNLRSRLSASRVLEAGAAGAVLVAMTGLSFLGAVPTTYFALPPLLWIAARFKLQGAAIGLTILALLVVGYATLETGLPADVPQEAHQRVVALEIFLGLSAICALVVAAMATEGGRTLAQLKAANDLLERRIAERTAIIRDRERRLSAILEALPVGLAIVARNGDLELANEVFRRYVPTRIPSADDARHGLWEGYHPDGNRIDRNDYPGARALRGERVWPGEEFLFHPENGPPIWTRIAALPIRNSEGDVIGATAIINEIDREKRIADALRDSEQRFRDAIDATKALIYEVNFDADSTDSTYGVANILGTDEAGASLTSDWWHSRIHPDDLDDHLENLQRCLADAACSTYKAEYRVRRYDGSWRDVADTAQFIRGSDGAALRLVGIVRDISVRKQSEAAAARLAAIVSSTSESIISKSLQGEITTWNEAAEKMFGYTAAEAVGMSIRRLVPVDRLAEEDEILARLARRESIRNFETVRQRKDGTLIELSVSISPIIDESGNEIGASEIAHDISERKRAQEREQVLMQEINHRTKNLLSVIQSIVRQTALTESSYFVERLEKRIESLASAQDLIAAHSWNPVPLEAVVRSQLAPFADLLGTRIVIQGPTLLIAPPAAQMLSLVIHALATNAAKYGALSAESGAIEIDWLIEASNEVGREFIMSWKERGGPSVREPIVKGFGSSLTTSVIELALDGKVAVNFHPSGLEWRLTCLLANIAAVNRPKPSHKEGETDFLMSASALLQPPTC